MAFLDGLQKWRFRNVDLARVVTSPRQWEEWFGQETIVSIAPILDSQERYVDVGGSSYTPLSLILAFPTLDDRLAFLPYRGTIGTIERLGYNARSGTALLRQVQEIASTGDGFHLLACTFEAVSQ